MAGRKSKYYEHVLPELEHIKEWVMSMSEKQIAERLGISEQTLNNYKNEHEELRQALKDGRKALCSELKDSLRKKALGFMYTETKTVIRKEGDKEIRYIEKYEKYAQPDTGAIHLLLKNLDDDWHNDDVKTLDLKAAQVEIQKMKAEMEEWD